MRLKNLIWFWLLILVIFTVGLILGSVFLFKKTEEKMNEYINIKKEFSSFQKKVSFLENQKKKLDEVLPLFSKIENAFFEIKKDEIKNEKLGKFLNDIETVGKNHNVSVETKNITEPKSNENFYLFDFDIKGSFPDVLKFLFNIENTPMENYYLIEINKINFSRMVSGECVSSGGQTICQPAQQNQEKIEAKGNLTLKLYTKPTGQQKAQNENK